MSSAIIIGDILAPFPELANITERVMILKDLKLDEGQGRRQSRSQRADAAHDQRRLPSREITIAPGELQFWRIGNLGANIYYDLVMPGVTFNVIAVDGNLQNQITDDRRADHAARWSIRGAGARTERSPAPTR